MPDEIVPHAQPIAPGGDAEWFPPVEDDTIAAGPPAAPERSLRWVFFGDDGLRAGWSVLLFVLLLFAFGWLVKTVLQHALPSQGAIGHSREMPVTVPLIGDWTLFLAVSLAAFVVSRVERRSFARYGIGPLHPHRVKQLLAGCAWGFVLLSGLVLLLHFTGLLAWNGVLLHGPEVVKWGALWFLAFLGVGFFEEFLTRGFLQFTLARGLAGIAGAVGASERSRRVIGFWVVAIFFSFLFGLGHKGNPGESPIGLASAGLIGLAFAFSLWRTGSLWWAIGYHAAWDWAQSFLWGVADSGGVSQHRYLSTQPEGAVLMSGGLTGPEGSVYVLLMIAITVAIIAVTLKPEPGSASMDIPASPDLPTR